MKPFITIDFETEGIEPRPKYPPVPVGVSIKFPRWKSAKYYAWGHPTKNNCTKIDAVNILNEAYRSDSDLLFFNGKFDVDVASTHLGLPVPSWERIQDAMFLVFLNSPHESEMGLKPSAEKILGLPPDEQDAVKDWVLENVLEAKRKPSSWGGYIAKAPGDLVGKYANGDVLRTENLFKALYQKIVDAGMLEAYNRERRLMPILLENEKTGVRLDLERLEIDLEDYERQLIVCDAWIRRKLKTPSLNLDSNEELADALERFDPNTTFLLTPKGQRSVSKDSLQQAINNKQIFNAIGYRNRLTTCLSTFMRPWLEIGVHNRGMLQCNWSQIRQSKNDKMTKGARTGRLIAAEPNLLNLSKVFEGRNDGYIHPAFMKVRELPLVRRYLLPDKGGVWCHRDYNQQELRILGHFEDGDLCHQYNTNPKLDVHDFVTAQIKSLVGLVVERRQSKILNFGMIYGMGIAALSNDLDTPVENAKRLKNAQREALPDLGNLEKEIRERGRSNLPIKTWGGRLYYTEEPTFKDGKKQSYEYKLLNYLIQGSAADCTKEAVIRYNEHKKNGRFLVTVYDEVNISSPNKAVKSEMKILKDVMQGIEFDVPMLSDGKIGPSWGELSKFED